MTQRSIKLFYRKKSWGEVQNIDMYLKLEAPTVIYDTAEGMPIGQPAAARHHHQGLPAGGHQGRPVLVRDRC
ncbi:hypothetical protein [Limosilactobacillus sp.]|uniref:hypothetical protein n=1 Tax=Limosilactobacillus sp. TaxID=2773925 RepID=UPI00345E6E71